MEYETVRFINSKPEFHKILSSTFLISASTNCYLIQLLVIQNLFLLYNHLMDTSSITHSVSSLALNVKLNAGQLAKLLDNQVSSCL